LANAIIVTVSIFHSIDTTKNFSWSHSRLATYTSTGLMTLDYFRKAKYWRVGWSCQAFRLLRELPIRVLYMKWIWSRHQFSYRLTFSLCSVAFNILLIFLPAWESRISHLIYSELKNGPNYHYKI
jgi:hypothetical protein